MSRGWRMGLVILLLVGPVAPVLGEDAAAVLGKLRTLLQTTRKWTDRTQELKLRIVDKRGGERHRVMSIRTKKYEADRSRTLVRFEAPADVKGVMMLQWADPKDVDQQWLYLPELRKSRRVAGGAQRESFVGTDFSYEDLAIMSQFQDWTDSEARANLLRVDKVGDKAAHVLELVPTGKQLAYAKVLVWLTVDDSLALQFELQERDGETSKRLTLSDVRPVGNIPTPFHMEMHNLPSGSYTVADFTTIQYDSGLEDHLFTQRSLQ